MNQLAPISYNKIEINQQQAQAFKGNIRSSHLKDPKSSFNIGTDTYAMGGRCKIHNVIAITTSDVFQSKVETEISFLVGCLKK